MVACYKRNALHGEYSGVDTDNHDDEIGLSALPRAPMTCVIDLHRPSALFSI